MMIEGPVAGVHYLHMGPWPGFIAFTNDEKAFKAELERLGLKQEVEMLAHGRASASLHEFVTERGSCIWILTVGSLKQKSKEMVAGLIAHEAMHIVQNMRSEFGDLGTEAEAYLMQMIVQEVLQFLWKSGRVRAEVPGL